MKLNVVVFDLCFFSEGDLGSCNVIVVRGG